MEIKRSCHRNVWKAVRSQLIAKYTRDPRASGYGIYLVLWFGDTEKCRPTECAGWTPEAEKDVRLRIQQSLDGREGRLFPCVWWCRNAAVVRALAGRPEAGRRRAASMGSNNAALVIILQ